MRTPKYPRARFTGEKTGQTRSDNIGSASTIVPKRYVVNLRNHLAICESNYQQFMRLLPGLNQGVEEWSFGAGNSVPLLSKPVHFNVSIKVKESSPYTTTINVIQTNQQLESPKITVRLYHDADVAEIIEWNGHRHWQPTYDYPNDKMYQPDEKIALNRFLFDWLVFCHNKGFVSIIKCDQILFSVK